LLGGASRVDEPTKIDLDEEMGETINQCFYRYIGEIYEFRGIFFGEYFGLKFA